MSKKIILLSVAIHLFIIAAFYKTSTLTQFHIAKAVLKRQLQFVQYDGAAKIKKIPLDAIQPANNQMVVQRIVVSAKREFKPRNLSKKQIRLPNSHPESQPANAPTSLAENQEQQMLENLIEAYTHPRSPADTAEQEQKL